MAHPISSCTPLSCHTTELGLMLSSLMTHQLWTCRYPSSHGWLVRFPKAKQTPKLEDEGAGWCDFQNVRLCSG
jgi:hypothetical protein